MAQRVRGQRCSPTSLPQKFVPGTMKGDTRKRNSLSTRKLNIFIQAKQKLKKNVRKNRDMAFIKFLRFMVFKKTF